MPYPSLQVTAGAAGVVTGYVGCTARITALVAGVAPAGGAGLYPVLIEVPSV